VIELDTAIIGGGFSGCAVAAHVERRVPMGFSLAIFEPGELGRGAAYGTRHGAHLLNTRARVMSLFPDDPNHFVRWLGARAEPGDFVSRQLYGAYVNEIAQRTLARPRFTHVADRVQRVSRRDDGFIIKASQGTRYAARTVVLATGNPLPTDTFLPRAVRLHPGYIPDPWRFDFQAVGGHVLIVGSGLTALDVLSALESSGHRGAVTIISRRGRFPQVHADVASYDVIPALDTRDARSLLRSFRRHVAEAEKRGFDWRAVVDAVRPEAEAIWRRVSPAEQCRFERHLRTHWDRHRHRAPQQVDAVRQRYRDSNRLTTYAGTLHDGSRGNGVSLALRDGRTIELRPDWIVNCTGVAGASAMAKDPLFGELLADGLISAAGGLGLRATHDLVAIAPAGARTPGLYLTGPPVRGSRFEAIAVPELRVMAESISEQIVPFVTASKAPQACHPERRLLSEELSESKGP
jgi:uncharacterized NAD(P)/FAD-binding protein YdhS